MKIYFAGSIRGGRTDVSLYLELIEHLKQFGEVLTEHIGNAALTQFGENETTDEFIHNRDMDWLMSADVIVAEVTHPSLGVGYELGRALEQGKKVLCLFRNQEGKKLSAMISGSGKFKVEVYSNANDGKLIISDYLNELLNPKE